MKKNVLFALLIIFVSCKNETKKTSTVVLKNKTIKSEKILPTKDTLQIIGNNIWVRKTPKTGKVVFKLNDGIVCTILEKGMQDTIKQDVDVWYKIKTDNKTGWVFGSQTSRCYSCKSKEEELVSEDFTPFLKTFLQTSFFGKNTDSLLRYKSPTIYKYVHKEIGFTRYHNPGVTCVPQEYNKSNYRNENYPKLNLPFYNKQPKDGFCEKSKHADGIYYYHTKKLPDYPVFTEDDYVMKSIPLKKYKNAPIKVAIIIHEGWIIKQLFFIKVAKKWWLVLSDDCDCSA